MCREPAPSVILPAARGRVLVIVFIYACYTLQEHLAASAPQTAITGPWDAPAEASGPLIGSSVDLSRLRRRCEQDAVCTQRYGADRLRAAWDAAFAAAMAGSDPGDGL